jgi:hypothetical protein
MDGWVLTTYFKFNVCANAYYSKYTQYTVCDMRVDLRYGLCVCNTPNKFGGITLLSRIPQQLHRIIIFIQKYIIKITHYFHKIQGPPLGGRKYFILK